MYRRACPLALFALAVWLVLTRRRLSDARAELRLLRLAARAHGAGIAGRPAQEAERPAHEMTPPSPAQPAVSGAVASEGFSEWEGAVAPMDS